MKYTEMPEDERALSFPTQFPVKGMGGIQSDVKAVMCRVLSELSVEYTESNIKLTTSSSGKYESVTITIIAQSREQLDAVYETLAAQDEILMTL